MGNVPIAGEPVSYPMREWGRPNPVHDTPPRAAHSRQPNTTSTITTSQHTCLQNHRNHQQHLCRTTSATRTVSSLANDQKLTSLNRA
eukprot:XP_001691626.1 predicted protein [Chlamydomonas reinhardtii]